MTDFIKTNKTASTLFALMPVLLVVLLSMQGCSPSRFFKHDVPPAMQDVAGSDKVSLADSPLVREAYVQEVQRNLTMYDMAAEEVAILFDIFNAAVSFGVQEMGTSAIPGGTILLSLLGIGGATMIPRPGTARQIAKEKEDSFNAGQEKAIEHLKPFVTPDQIGNILAAMRANSETPQ